MENNVVSLGRKLEHDGLCFFVSCDFPAVCTAQKAPSASVGRLYTDKHEWVEVSNENVATVGISHYAQEALGDVVFAQLPSIGTEIKQHDEVGALESVKAASELYSPVSGKVVEVNTEVENAPALINKACYTQGWLFKVLLSNSDELKSLMDEDSYSKFLKSDAH
ncbi:hypothetical protein GE061_004815 [Apolygus lucorum]|uniref:Glycine cleavage system H protein n=1 Tax=Apolygus lucorum TaxID=248454 RepID=A0A8S9X2V7_APOLU|nr:hypothetical protein GE061_004815 [Apolygus lucorum]